MADEPSEKKPEPQPDQQGESKPAAPKPDTAAAKPPAPPAGDKPAAPAAKPAAPPAKKEEVKPLPLDNELVQRLRKKFGEAIVEAVTDRKQAIVTVATSQLAEIAEHCRDAERFNLLVDLTAVDWPRREKRFDIILNLYSFERNERLRLKAHAAEGEKVPSVAGVFSTANWLERECYDMFGVAFDGHPDLRRILLPEEWQGHPLRKDYDILTQDTAWVKENLNIESGQ